jgi:hypothetical protein
VVVVGEERCCEEGSLFVCVAYLIVDGKGGDLHGAGDQKDATVDEVGFEFRVGLDFLILRVHLGVLNDGDQAVQVN